MNTQAVKQSPILIIGAGPTGLTASLLLSRYSIPHILVDRRSGPIAAPAAHVINRRTMEIFRQCGLEMEHIYELDHHGHNPMWVRWSSDLKGDCLAELNVTAFAEDSSHLSQERMANISQFRLEALLLEQVSQSPHSTVLLAHEWLGFADENTYASNIRTPDGETITVQSTYLLAADGAGSPIRRTLEIGQSGPKNITTFLALSLKARTPKDTLLNWCLDPKFSGVTISHHPTDLTVYMRQLFEPWETEADFDEETCRDLLADLFAGQEPELIRKDVWRMTAQVADKFRVGPVFLIGDAAHRFPPTGGLGLNSGVADGHNLVWKIAACIKGADERLLDSYEQERKPVVQNNCEQSLKNFRKMDDVIRAIGLDPDQASIPARILSSLPLRYLPNAVRSAAFNLLALPIRRLLNQKASDEASRTVIQASVNQQRAHFDMPGLELGYQYEPGIAIVADGQQKGPAKPGQRLPHVQLACESAQSSLDLLACDAYTLISSGNPNCDQFETFNLPLNHLDTTSKRLTNKGLEEAFAISPDGWILVRPDGHIAARG